MPPVVRMENITKVFPGVVANHRINLEVEVGEVHALLGENGAGKTTLMNILYGLHQPEEGNIYLRGRRVSFQSPRDAIREGIGMVHQHFTLVPSLTALEKIILGLRSPREPFLDLEGSRRRVEELAKRYGLAIDPDARVWQLSVGAQQRVEVINALYRKAQFIILDEPTSVLTPQEARGLFRTLRTVAAEGHSVIFISHKLDEVMEVADRITVLRDGRVVSTVDKRETDKYHLAQMMVGREVLLQVTKGPPKLGEVALEVQGLKARNNRGLPALNDVSFSLREGEILGVAGVDGNGQTELAEVITGLRRATGGRLLIYGRDMANRSPREMMEAGLGHIPEDRQGMGLIMDFSLSENLILQSYHRFPFARRGFLNLRAIEETARDLLLNYDVRPAIKGLKAAHLSGGNQQKLIIARQFHLNPRILVAVYPTRGLDIGATEYVYEQLLKSRDRGTAILFISNDLEEILSLSDRIAVMYEGRIVGIVPGEEANVEEIGLMMAGAYG